MTDTNWNVLNTFVRRLAKIGIRIELAANYPWIYLDKVNGKRVHGTFYANHGWTAFMLPARLDAPVRFTDRKAVFEKVREVLQYD
jgi:hypothetical protein